MWTKFREEKPQLFSLLIMITSMGRSCGFESPFVTFLITLKSASSLPNIHAPIVHQTTQISVSPIRRHHALKNCLVTLVFDVYNELIGADDVVLVQSWLKLIPAEFTCKSSADGA